MVEKRGQSSARIDERGDAVWQRLADDARELGLDPRMGSHIFRLLIKGLIKHPQAAAADKVGQIYGDFERVHGIHRSAQSPSYQMGRGGGGEVFDDEEAETAERDFRNLQDLIPQFPREVRDVLETLCVENRHITGTQLQIISRTLWRIAAALGLGLAPVVTREDKFEGGTYASTKIGRLSGDHAPEPMTDAEAAEISKRNLERDIASLPAVESPSIAPEAKK